MVMIHLITAQRLIPIVTGGSSELNTSHAKAESFSSVSHLLHVHTESCPASSTCNLLQASLPLAAFFTVFVIAAFNLRKPVELKES